MKRSLSVSDDDNSSWGRAQPSRSGALHPWTERELKCPYKVKPHIRTIENIKSQLNCIKNTGFIQHQLMYDFTGKVANALVQKIILYSAFNQYGPFHDHTLVVYCHLTRRYLLRFYFDETLSYETELTKDNIELGVDERDTFMTPYVKFTTYTFIKSSIASTIINWKFVVGSSVYEAVNWFSSINMSILT